MCWLVAAAGNHPERVQKIQQQSIAPELQQDSEVLFKNLKGDTISLSSLKGKVVFINFWATWCLPCRVEMPSIQKLKNTLEGEDRIVFLMVDVDDNMKASAKFLKKRKLNFRVYAPASGLPNSFLNRAIPTTVILDKEGEMALRVEGAVDYSSEKVKKAILQLIHE